jgi:hypothetical protein
MGIYFLIAVALSAMSVVTEVQVARPACATVASVRAEQRIIRSGRRTPSSACRATARLSPRRADGGVRPYERLTASAPRAPSRGC